MISLKATTIPLIAAGFFALSAPANASDLLDGLNDPAPAETQARVNWTGLWVGAVGGYQFSNTEGTFDEGEIDKDDGEHNWQDVGNIDGFGSDRFFGEGQVGFDYQASDRIVVGIFGGYNVNDAEFSASEQSGVPLVTTGSMSFEQEWGAVVGARVGLLKSQQTMFYAAGGWAFGEFGDVKVNGVAAFTDQETDLNGWFGELGMETQVANNIFLTVSGRYTDHNSIDILNASSIDGNGDTDYQKFELDHDTLAVMVGLKAKLGGF